MIDEVFGESGLLAKRFAGYAPRKGQVDMARAVEQAIARGRHLVVEGPTGTGKSLAYLAPAIDHAVREAGGGNVIVVTANIALQEQLVTKDLPLLQDVLETPFRFALAKGRNNYVCLDALGKTLGEKLLGCSPDLEALLEWAQRTETGDASEFPDQPSPMNWRRVSTTTDECKGRQCRYFQQCFAEKAKAATIGAHVVVTNYHMFFAHLLVRQKMREIQARGGDVQLDVVLPPAAVVIFDEAHKAADIARDFLGFQLTKGQVEWLVRGFKHELADEARRECERFLNAAKSYRASRMPKAGRGAPRGKGAGCPGRLKKDHPIDGEAFARVLDRVSSFYKVAAGAGAWTPDERAELEVRQKRGATLAAQVRRAMRPGDYPDEVFYVEENEKGAATIKSKPIVVAPFLKEELFGNFETVVLTSATLATGAGSFEYLKKEVGLEECDELAAESPFAFGDKVLLVVPDSMCMPDEYDLFPGEVAKHVRDACEAANGRTLGLFTSHKNLGVAAEEMRGFRHRVLRQGDAPRMRLMQQFRDDVHSVLLGTDSFWAGVDVPGESLSCVVIDRLPFPTPDDPIVDAISERDDNWFFNHAVPRAVIQVKQGFGRLIRTTTDRGCVVILDRRILTKSYGRSFIKALPKMLMSDDVADVGKFLGQSGG